MPAHDSVTRILRRCHHRPFTPARSTSLPRPPSFRPLQLPIPAWNAVDDEAPPGESEGFTYVTEYQYRDEEAQGLAQRGDNLFYPESEALHCGLQVGRGGGVVWRGMCRESHADSNTSCLPMGGMLPREGQVACAVGGAGRGQPVLGLLLQKHGCLVAAQSPPATVQQCTGVGVGSKPRSASVTCAPCMLSASCHVLCSPPPSPRCTATRCALSVFTATACALT